MERERIVVKRMGARGDVILTTPIVRALRRQNPKTDILMVTMYPDAFFGNPDVTAIFMDWNASRDRSCTIDLDAVHEGAVGQHMVAAYAEAAGLELAPAEWAPVLYFDRAAKDWAAAVMPSGKKYAIVHPGRIHGWAGRQWPWEQFEALLPRLQDLGYSTVQVGGFSDSPIDTDVDARGVDLGRMAAAMARASLFVGLDSMPFHASQAFDIPSVVIFGSIRPELRVIPGNRVIPVTLPGLYCLGCHHKQVGARVLTSSCPEGHHRCMSDLTVDHVVDAINRLGGK